MAKTRLIYWIDVGMAIIAGVFIAIVIFLRGEAYYIPVLLVYGAVVMVWAFLAESAAVSAERKQPTRTSDPGMQRTTYNKLLPH
jgi:hypothetical protein